MQLSKAKRNEVFRAVAAGMLDVAACQMDHEKELTISHATTKSWFRAKKNEYGGYHYKARIGTDPEYTWSYQGISWEGLLTKITTWSERVVVWEGTPDFWELRHDWKFLAEQQYEDSPNVLFSPQEQDSISAQLSAIKESVKKTYALTAEQESSIDAQFDEAEKAAKRLGRKDWVLLFAGGIFSLILTDIITPDIAQHILTMAVHGLEHLFISSPNAIRAE